MPLNQTPSSNSAATVGTISVADVRALIGRAAPPAVSVLMPLDPNPNSSEKTRLVLKQLTGEARRLLSNWPGADADELLRSLHDIARDDTWWRGPGRGYAHYISGDGTSMTFRLPIDVAPRAFVNAQFAVRDLLPAITGQDRFCLLSLSQNHVTLYQADRYEMRAVESLAVPGSLREALQYYEHSNDLNTHGGGPFGAGVHGQSSQRDHRKVETLQFLRSVDDAVLDAIGRDNPPPLVLAMVESMAALYRSASHHPLVVDEVVAGNPDRAPAFELHQRAVAAAAPVFAAERNRDLARFDSAGGTPLVSTDVGAVVAGAAVGRVHALLVAGHEPLWGAFDSDSTRVSVHERHQAGDEDLVNRAAIETIAHGGVVHTDVAHLATPMAALFRY